MFSSAAIVDFLLRTAEPLPETPRPASALPWAPPTWQSGRQDDQASEPDTKDTKSETAAQEALPRPRPAEDAVSSEDEEVSIESANVNTPAESWLGEVPDTPWVRGSFTVLHLATIADKMVGGSCKPRHPARAVSSTEVDHH